MKKTLLIGIVFLVLSVSVFARGNAENDTENVTLRVATVAVEGQYHPYSEACVVINDYLMKNTDGKFKLKTYYGGSLTGDEKEMLLMIKDGSLDMAVMAPSPLTTYEPVVAILSLPYLFKDLDHAEIIMSGEVGEFFSNKIEARGFKVINWMIGKGFRSINAGKPITVPSDLAGMKVRVMEDPAYIDTFKAFGAQPVPIAWGELHTALQTKTIDAHENDPQVLDEYSFIEFAKFISLTEHSLSPTPIIIGKAKFDSLSPEYQKLLMEAGEIARVHGREVADAGIRDAFDGIMAQGGTINNVNKEAFRAAALPVVNKYKNAFGAEGSKIVDLILQ